MSTVMVEPVKSGRSSLGKWSWNEREDSVVLDLKRSKLQLPCESLSGGLRGCLGANTTGGGGSIGGGLEEMSCGSLLSKCWFVAFCPDVCCGVLAIPLGVGTCDRSACSSLFVFL